MPRRVARLTLLLAAFAATPALAQQAGQTGGTPAGAPAGSQTSQVAVVSDGAFSLTARSDTVLGRTAAFRGTVPAEHAGRALTVERLDPRSGQWAAAAKTTVGSSGAFVARWRTDHIGRFRIRARVDTSETTHAQAASATPELAVTIYKPALATWYGPGFYGRRTACGIKMSRTLVGVAHRTLPCGTQVALFFGGRTVVVPVVDRGPFANGASWDLTKATADSLGFTVTGTVGAVRLREPALQASS
jgi:hypothetical protein